MDTFDRVAEKQLEIVVGSDEIVRINLDGVCAMRVRLARDAEFLVDYLETKRA